MSAMGSIAVGQRQLLEPPPVRRLVVPRSRTSWWGVDPSTARVAVAYSEILDGEVRRGVATLPFAPGEGPTRLSHIYDETRAFVMSLMPAFPKPGVVLVEQPSGKFDNPSLSYAVGCIQAAVVSALRESFGRPPHVETTVAQHWKKISCGRGDIYKPTRKALGRTPVFEDYAVARWAREQGYAGSSWDEADAMGIADCARREIALEER